MIVLILLKIENAMNLFKSTDIDVLVVGNTIYKKQNV
jgi:hypothetical protein